MALSAFSLWQLGGVPRSATLRVFARRALSRALATGSAQSSTSSRSTPDITSYRIQFSLPTSTGSRRWLSQEVRRRGRRSGPRGGDGGNGTEVASEEASSTSEPTPSYASSELIPSVEMLKRIVADCKNNGTAFIIPFGNDELIEQMLNGFKELYRIGVRPEFLISACVSNPKLFRCLTTRGGDTVELIQAIQEQCGMTYEDSIRLVATYSDDLTTVGSGGVQERLSAVIACGVVEGGALGAVIRSCPALLFAREPQQLRKAAEALCNFFSRKQIANIIRKCPEVLLNNIEETEEKYEYIYYQMCIDGEQFMKSRRWALLSLQEIMRRHQFLMKCGTYHTPDPKRPQLKMENPELHQILDLPDRQFATQIAKVSYEEWLVYQSLIAKQEEAAAKGNDRPFERIKPSMRKAYERRRKQAIQKEAHVFDVTTDGE